MPQVSLEIPQASPVLVALSKRFDLILGSSSRWRRQVVESSGVRIASAISPDIDEKAIRHPDPKTLTLAIANAKADALTSKIPQSGILICSDQVSVCCGEIREKPESVEEATTFVKSYSAGNPVTTVSAVVLVDLASGRRVGGHHEAVVKFRKIPDDAIVHITRPGSVVYTCAGGFTVESPEMRGFVDSIEGGVDSVMGMPLGLLERLLAQLLPDASF